MILRRWSFVLIAASLLGSAACATRPATAARPPVLPAEALSSESTIRARCEDPEGVLAGRVFCVLRDLSGRPDQ
jgi:hypothetical protein